ncbi:MAG TPA: rhodanese-like domain-containing protein [Coleofasciculaceae cyanobacterium]
MSQGSPHGAIAMPINELVTQARVSLEFDCGIYVYGKADEQTAEAAPQLREAGYENVAELIGG